MNIQEDPIKPDTPKENTAPPTHLNRRGIKHPGYIEDCKTCRRFGALVRVVDDKTGKVNSVVFERDTNVHEAAIPAALAFYSWESLRALVDNGGYVELLRQDGEIVQSLEGLEDYSVLKVRLVHPESE